MFKGDFYVTGVGERDSSVMERARHMPYGAKGKTARFMSPEDAILYKLEWYAQGRSEKHLRDINAMLGTIKIENQYIQLWATRLGVHQVWEELYRRFVECSDG